MTTPTNPQVQQYNFLEEMYQDPYFPKDLVDKGRDLLLDLCRQIEAQQPTTLEELYQLTHATTEQFNDLEREFEERGSEIETVAREVIAVDFHKISECYGFEEADIEELIAPREW